MQTCSWFRRFVPNFATVIYPLSKLMKKNMPWQWTNEQQNAFDKMKHLLTTAPILQQADHSKPFAIKTDASANALGAVMIQKEKAE